MRYEYDVEKINAILLDFYIITKIKTVIFDSDFTAISSIPKNECSFCSAMAENKTSKELCQKCNYENLLKCQKKRELIIYNCHAGLVEAVAPIFIDDIIVGYIMLGQVLKENSNKDEIAEYANEFIGKSAKEYLEELVAKNDNEIQAVARMMQSCVCYLLMHKIIKEEHGNLLFEIKKYIEENPAADLSTNALCKNFNISRNYLYKISNSYFGMPIASYVRFKRLKHAEQLIKDGCSVTLAAERTGFTDYGYFGKLFKRYIGKTPLKSKT